MTKVAEALPQLDPTLAGAAKTTIGKMEHDLQALHSKVIHAAKKRDETLRRQFMRVQAQIFPLGHPQERTLAVIYFLNQYGPALVDRLLDDLPLEIGQHWIADDLIAADTRCRCRERAAVGPVRAGPAAAFSRSSAARSFAAVSSSHVLSATSASRDDGRPPAPSLTATVRRVSYARRRNAAG